MALNSGARVPSLRHYGKVGFSGDEKAPFVSTTSPTSRCLLRKPLTPPWKPNSSGCLSRASTSPAIIFVLASGLYDGNSNSDPWRRVSAASSSYSSSRIASRTTLSASTPAMLCSSSSRRQAGRPSASAAAAALLQPHEFFVGSKRIELRRAGTSLLHGHNQTAGGQLDCRAATSTREGVTLDDVPHLSQWLPDLPVSSLQCCFGLAPSYLRRAIFPTALP